MAVPEPSDVLFADLHAVVTGGSRGIGAAIANMLDAGGARVTVMGRDRESAERHARALRKGTAIACDVTEPQSVEAAFREARAQGPVSILINSAGAVSSAAILKTDDTMIRGMLEINLIGLMRCTREVLPSMKAEGWGRIVNVASTAGLKGYPYVSAYCAAKHAVIGFTRALALEVVKSGITVNAVCPGYTDTDLVSSSVDSITKKTGRSRQEVLAELTSANPTGRLVTPDEVAAAVKWLCARDSGSITGQSIAVAGGELM